MPRMAQSTLLETLNRPIAWDDDVTIRFTWQKVTYAGIQSWAVIAIVGWDAVEDPAFFLIASDTLPDLPPALYPFGDTSEQVAAAEAFVGKYKADGAIDFIGAAGRTLTRQTAPADETHPRRLPAEMLDLVVR